MTQVDYDPIAPAFDRRYAHNRFDGIERALARFVGSATRPAVVEVGCGTGHWLASIADISGVVAGVDRSWAMLQRARAAAPHALLAHATAEDLPFASERFDRAFCVNALHHFTDQTAFLRECRRLLRVGGTFLTIGLDPHTGVDHWWIYDYFPAALAADRRRYLPTQRIRNLLLDTGFATASTEIVHHVPAERPFDLALEQGLLDRRSTSQLMVISDAEYESGMRRLLSDRPTLRADLRLFATVGELEGLNGERLARS